MMFPEESKPTTVTWTTFFATGGPTLSGLPQFVLTRLHARYGKDSLGADLVFKEADPIIGGREMMNASGKLEEGAMKSSSNNFQARYAIRHSWPGKIECASPKRGVWGGPWPDAGAAAGSGETIAATKLAYAPRGRIDVAKIFGNASLAALPVAEAAPGTDGDSDAAVDASAPADGGTADAGTAPAGGSKCGCTTPGGDGSIGAGAFIGLALAIGTFARRLVCSRER
jgi:hypothetical protein